jgi:hypothetical protein
MCSKRFEIAMVPVAAGSNGNSESGSALTGTSKREARLKLSECKRPLTEELMALRGIPLPCSLVTPLFPTLLPWTSFAVRPHIAELQVMGKSFFVGKMYVTLPWMVIGPK